MRLTPWIAGTAFGWALGWGVGSGVVLLPVVGQWWVLRDKVERAGWWPLAVLAGVIAGGAAVSALRLGAGVPLGASGDPVLGAVGGALLGGTQGAVNGTVLLRLLGSPTVPGRSEGPREGREQHTT